MPLISRNPNPAKSGYPYPVSIMVSSPSPWFIAYPGRAILRVDPMSVREGPPIVIDVRAPHLTKGGNIHPVAVLSHHFVEADSGSGKPRIGSVCIRQVIVITYR